MEIPGLKRYDIDSFGVRIHVAEVGDGPLVLFVHGFPESWYSWRHQLLAVAQAGWRAVAIDVRGYGSSEIPKAIDAYRLIHLAGDCVGVVEALGESSSVIVGHDWGSPIAATAARLRPDVFTSVALLSVAYEPRNEYRPSEIFNAMGDKEEFYIEYFQEPGRAEAEIAKNPAKWLEGFYFSASGDCPLPKNGEQPMGFVAPGGELSDRMKFPEEPLPWLDSEDLAFYIDEFSRTGFSGGLNRYRCIDLDWLDLRSWHGLPLHQPSLFIGAERDGPTIWGAKSISRYVQTLPNLYSLVILPNVGHWMQQEDPQGTNAALLNFLDNFR